MYFNFVEKNWKPMLIILIILAFICFSIPAFWPIGFPATVCLLVLGTPMLGVAVGIGAFKMYQSSRRSPRKKDDPHESLEKWKDVKKEVDILAQNTSDDLSQFAESEAKTKNKALKQTCDVKREDSTNTTIKSPLLSQPTSVDSCVQTILTTVSNPFRALFGSSPDSKSSGVTQEIEEIERDAKERLVVVGEALSHLNQDKEAKIAQLTANIEKLKEKKEQKEKINMYKKQ